MALVAKLSMIAFPAFMIMSGVMLGYLHRSNANQFQRIQTKLIDRGLFLLTIGHILIALAHSGVAGGILEAFNCQTVRCFDVMF